MPRELYIFGMVIPTLLLLFIFSVLALWLLDSAASRHGLYRLVWHPSLFRLAVFTIVFSGLGLLLMRGLF